MRKTKIICTLGPATDSPEVLENMILSGMNVARFNFSHGTHEEQLQRMNRIKEIRAKLGVPVAIVLDTKGPEIRLKKFEDGEAFLEKGSFFTLTNKDVAGNKDICSITYENLPKEVSVGGKILLDDGFISLEIEAISETDITCRVLNSGKIKNNKGVNLPDVKLAIPYISEQDRRDILFGVENNVEYIACSFVRSADDIHQVRKLMSDHGGRYIRIIAKIENSEGVDNTQEIIDAADGVMVARGDLGVEMDFAQIPIIQKELISRCYSCGKPAIIATHMLESMITNTLPTRAETSDVANAVFDGASAIMLSGETAVGIDPANAVKTMAAIAERTEERISYGKRFYSHSAEAQRLSIPDSVSHAACSAAIDIGAKAIITVTKSGETARFISKWRPLVPIIACAVNEHAYHQLALSWGVIPLIMEEVKTTDELLTRSLKVAQTTGILEKGDYVITTAGVPVGIAGNTNILKASIV